MLNYKVEPLTDDLIQEMTVRQNEYWKDVAESFHSFPPDVDWNLYLIAQANDKLKIVSGRSEEGELKAIAFVLITPHPHYACICASLPLIYLARECRNAWEGLKLIKTAEGVAKMSGAQLMMTHGGIHNKVARIFEFMKYDDFGRYFVKVLSNGVPVFKGLA